MIIFRLGEFMMGISNRIVASESFYRFALRKGSVLFLFITRRGHDSEDKDGKPGMGSVSPEKPFIEFDMRITDKRKSQGDYRKKSHPIKTIINNRVAELIIISARTDKQRYQTKA